MSEEKPKDQLHRLLFTNLVMMLSSSAMQQLGKMVNPLTNKTEVNLEGAQVTIDMLDMIREKTKGNLAPDEEEVLKDSLSALQLNYVETAKAGDAESKQEPQDTADASPEGSKTSEQEAEEPAPGNKDTSGPGQTGNKEPRDPKFHKSYGS